MNQVEPRGIWTCVFVCGAGCFNCLWDGPMFIADTATGGASLASGAAS